MELNKFKDKLFKYAASAGIKEFEIYFSEGESFNVGVYQQEVENYNVNTRSGLSFRGIYNGKMGYAYTEILDDSSVTMLVDCVKANAEIIQTDDVEFIYGESGSYSKLKSYFNDLAQISAADKIKLALDMEKATLAYDKRVKNARHCSVSYFEGKTRIINSKGLNVEQKSNGIYAVVIPIIADGENMKNGFAYKVTQKFDKLDAKALAKEAVEDALSYIGAKPVKAGKYRIALRNDAASDLLDTFSGIFSADRVHKGLSLLKGKVGNTISSKHITIIDDPLLKDGVCSGPFDSEGVPTYTKEVVSDGKLLTLLYNLKTANKDGVKTTGNASKGSYSSPVDISPSNFYIKPGTSDLKKLLGEMGEGLYITELEGLHSGANIVSGDFSLAAKGFVVSKGVIKEPVEQITIAGNFFKLLEDVEMVANDLKFGMPSGSGCFGSPAIYIKEIAVSG